MQYTTRSCTPPTLFLDALLSNLFTTTINSSPNCDRFPQFLARCIAHLKTFRSKLAECITCQSRFTVSFRISNEILSLPASDSTSTTRLLSMEGDAALVLGPSLCTALPTQNYYGDDALLLMHYLHPIEHIGPLQNAEEVSTQTSSSTFNTALKFINRSNEPFGWNL